MGADLYIEMVFESNYREWKPKFEEAVTKRDAAVQGTPDDTFWQKRAEEAYDRMYDAGYFRDSYNPSNVLWQYGLSWWDDVIPMLDEDGNLAVDKVEALLQMLNDRQPTFDENVSKFPERARQDFCERAVKLHGFLEYAIKLECPIHCSL